MCCVQWLQQGRQQIFGESPPLLQNDSGMAPVRCHKCHSLPVVPCFLCYVKGTGFFLSDSSTAFLTILIYLSTATILFNFIFCHLLLVYICCLAVLTKAQPPHYWSQECLWHYDNLMHTHFLMVYFSFLSAIMSCHQKHEKWLLCC